MGQKVRKTFETRYNYLAGVYNVYPNEKYIQEEDHPEELFLGEDDSRIHKTRRKNEF
ncbi:MAG: hypothetical protein ACOCQD_02775 [archaeon]